MIDTLVQQILIELRRFMIVAEKGKENLDETYFIIRTGSVKRIVESSQSVTQRMTAKHNNVTRFCNHSSIIPSLLVCKMFSIYPGMKLV